MWRLQRAAARKHEQRLQPPHAAAGQRPTVRDVVEVEVAAAHQLRALRGADGRRIHPRRHEAGGSHRRHRALVPVNARQRLLDVQRPALALGVATVPVEEAEGGVAGLLDLGDQHATADRVDRARGQEDAIAGPRLEAVQAVRDRAPGQRVAQGRLIDAGQQAGPDPAAGPGVEDKPGFSLAALARPQAADRLLVGVDLHRQPVVGVEELDQPGEGRIPRRGRPEQGRAPALHERAELRAGVRAGRDHAAVQGVVAYVPGLAVGFGRGQGFAEPLGQGAAAPDHRPQERLEAQRAGFRV